jgi:hypothetical protein
LPVGGKREGAGRPKGTPNKVTKELGESARLYTTKALGTLVKLMLSKKSSDMARIAAAKEILDRGYGKAKQSVEHSGDGLSINLVIPEKYPLNHVTPEMQN